MAADPIKSATEGVAKAGIDWTEEKVYAFLKKFRDHKLAFIKDSDNIELVKEERKSSEFSILKPFVPKFYYVHIQMGLTLRQIATEKVRVKALTAKIRKRFGSEGLHIAEMTQIGIMTQLLTRLSGLYRDPSEVTKRLNYFLEHAEDLALFVKNEDNPNAIIPVILSRIEASDAHIMILFGSGYARSVVENILEELDHQPRGYAIEIQQEGPQIIAFIYTPELRAKISHWSESLDVPTTLVKA